MKLTLNGALDLSRAINSQTIWNKRSNDYFNQLAKELKDDLKGDVRQLQLDKRHLEDIVDGVKNKTREELRLFEESIKDLESDLDLKINKALNNPLNALSN